MSLLTRDIKNAMAPHRDIIRDYSLSISGQQVLFKESNPTIPAQKIVHEVIDSLLRKNNIEMDFVLSGQATDSHCQFYMDENHPYYQPEFEDEKHKVCLCYYGHDKKGSFDFSLKPDQNKYLLKQAAGLLLPSSIFILLIVAAVSFTLYTLQKQKKLSELKNDFINNLTHEFKTPIFTIGLSSKMLGKSTAIQESPKLKSYLDLISNENKRLKNQVDKVLQIAHVQ